MLILYLVHLQRLFVLIKKLYRITLIISVGYFAVGKGKHIVKKKEHNKAAFVLHIRGVSQNNVCFCRNNKEKP